MINPQDFVELTEAEQIMIAKFLAISSNPTTEEAMEGIAIALYAFDHPKFGQHLEHLINVQQHFGGSPVAGLV